ncbi:hypothetical protein N7493_002320 [Penicillium malachiteum]|uniref:Cell wall galactomannoprotein n=1 Tax=Penicillium malachiteum TaxID=1324776 RepID=A0AAD6HRN7_9EURO|nr:hypothetical protein N7493_002320 [Penicillium malachiteum]
MQFKLPIISTLFAISAVASPVPSSETSCAQQVVSALNDMTQQVTDLKGKIAGTTDVITLANDIISGFDNNIVTLVTGVSLSCDSTLTKQDQEDVCNSAQAFINEDQSLITTLNNKHTILSGSIWLHAVESAISGLASATSAYLTPIIDNAPVCGGIVKSELQALETAINKAVGAY